MGRLLSDPRPLPARLVDGLLGEHEVAVIDHLRNHLHNSAVCEICRVSRIAREAEMCLNEIIGG